MERRRCFHPFISHVLFEPIMETTWNIHTISPQEDVAITDLALELHVSRLSARILYNRGIRNKKQATAYVHPSLDALHDPFLMRDMDKAVERLTRAIHNGEKILVYGDYDVDGTTAGSLAANSRATACRTI